MSIAELRVASWEVMQQYFDKHLNEYIGRLGDAQANGKGSVVVSDIAREANSGRVELLLLEEDAALRGHVDWQTGAVTESDLNHSDVDDVMDDVAELVIARGGTVRIVRSGSLRKESKIGPIYRY